MTARYVLSALGLSVLFGCASPLSGDPCAKEIIKDGNMPSAIKQPSTTTANAPTVGMTVTRKSSDPACKR